MIAAPCKELESRMGALFSCSEINGHVRIRTPFVYPDGDVIDIFLKQTPGGNIFLTDLGETLRWLRTQSASPKRTIRQRRILEDICMAHRVEVSNSELLIPISPSSDSFADAVTRLSQACSRVADIWFTFRIRSISSVTDEVADFMDDSQIQYESSTRHVGKSGREWKIDFEAKTPQATTLVQVLTTGTKGAVRPITEHVFTAWYDLRELRNSSTPTKLVSLFDDTMDVWGDEDISLLDLKQA